ALSSIASVSRLTIISGSNEFAPALKLDSEQGKILSVKNVQGRKGTYIEVNDLLKRYIVERGSITVDGISLTVVSILENIFELVLIPETIKKTNASSWNINSIVNIETDIMARYLEKFNKY
ncbi:MAG: hypothetical protein EBS19_15490, partial [Spirochaetia bacterium]|nr:hypothetical protein [Spirochaetia bacterium]